MSAISWTDHSFAPWFGCTRVSPACDHCYAEDWTVRRFHKAGWGTQTPRIRSAASTWQKPKTWNRAAAQQGTPLFLFCSELSDVFDNQAPDAWRADLWRLIRETPALIWLVLTKRPQNMRRMLPPDWGTGYTNVWLGVSAENQRETDRRLPILCHTPCLRRSSRQSRYSEQSTCCPGLACSIGSSPAARVCQASAPDARPISPACALCATNASAPASPSGSSNS